MKNLVLAYAAAVSALATVGGVVVALLVANATYQGALWAGLGWIGAPLAVAIEIWALWEFCNFPSVLTNGDRAIEVRALAIGIANVCMACFYLTLPST